MAKRISNKYISAECSSLMPESVKNICDLVALPLGGINFKVSDTTWNTLNADTIIISSPYETNILVRGEHSTGFLIEPDQTHQFSWHYIKGGINGNTITKEIYVPPISDSVFPYEITF